MGLRKSIGKTILELRKAKKKTQEEVARDGGLSRAEFAQIENGNKRAYLDTILKVAKGLEISLIGLLEKVDFDGISNFSNPEQDLEQHIKVQVSPTVSLYYRGDKTLLKNKKRVAIIGKKNPTEYGIKACELVTKWHIEHGYIIVSGLEKGCDTVVQNTCLKQGGHSICVISSGLRNIHPKENSKLADELVKSGGLLLSNHSENSSPRPPYYFESRKIQEDLGMRTILIESQLDGNEMKAGLYAIKEKKKLGCMDTPEKYWNSAKGNIILIREHEDNVLVLTDKSLDEFR